MKAAVLTEYGTIQWLDVKDPRIAGGEVLIKVTYAGICGSDQHVFKGEFQPRTSLPLIPGHEFAGTVVDVSGDVTRVKSGDRVTVDPIYWCGSCPACELGHYPACSSLKLLGIDADGGFGQYVTARETMLHKLDDSVSDRHAALIEMLSIGFHACNRAALAPGHTLAVFGAGRIGQSILQAARTITDETVFMVDILPGRLAIACRSFDGVTSVNAAEQDPVEAIRELTAGRGVDVAIEAVGRAHPVQGQPHPVVQCVHAIRAAGTVCVLGLGDEPVPLLMKDLIWKEARLVASRVSHGEFTTTIKHLSAGTLNPDAMISREMPANEAQEAFTLLDQDPERYLKILLKIP